MIEVPAFNPRYRVYPLREGAVLVGEAETVLLRGRAYAELARLVDGRRTLADIASRLEQAVPPGTARRALERARARRYVVEAPRDGAPGAAERFWQAQGVDPAQWRARVQAAGVHVAAAGGLDAGPCRAALRAAGLALAADADAALAVVLTDDYGRPELGAYNAGALRRGRPWLLARPVGETVSVGPLFLPGATGCWQCLRRRLEMHRPVEQLLRRRLGVTGPVLPVDLTLPAGALAALQLVAAAVARWVALGDHPGLAGRVVTTSLLTLESRTHILTRLPQCPACGRPAHWGRAPEPFRPRSVPAAALDDGGARSAPPEAFLARVAPHISPITGIVADLKPLGDPAGPIRLYGAGHNLAFLGEDLAAFRLHVRQGAGGKGATDLQARASALGEAVERYSGVFQGYEPVRTARYADLGGQAVHPQLLTGFSDAQYAGRQRPGGRPGRGRTYVPPPLDPEAAVPWSPVWSLTRGALRYVPTAFCYYGFPSRAELAASCCLADSNGCACGATREEALLQGLLELVERDAVAVWWYNRLPRPGIDLQAAPAHVRRVAEHMARSGRRLWALDLTGDVGIPVVAAVAAPAAGAAPGSGVAAGFAAHLDPQVALLRAVNECGQTAATLEFLSGAAGLPDEPTAAWLRRLQPEREVQLQPCAAAPRAPRRTGACPPDVAEALEVVRGRLEALGLEVLVLDQSRPDTGIPAVRAIVPGLRHFWPRFAPGRLYDVPVRMGWLERPRREEDLNPLPMLL